MIVRHLRRAAVPALALLAAGPAHAQNRTWPPNSPDRPRPAVVTPAPAGPTVAPPSDAIVLFDGHDLRGWMAADSSAATWTVRDGYLEVVPGAGSLVSRRAFGSIQLHIEWAAPTPPEGEGQERGNSGVFVMSHYEIQVLDSYENVTYADGQAGATYGQTPPLANAARPPGQWQTYDIVFHRPMFAADGSLRRPARVTVFWNGVLVQDETAITGWTVHGAVARYQPHPDRLPLVLQDHHARVRYRNIWVREIVDGRGDAGAGGAIGVRGTTTDRSVLARSEPGAPAIPPGSVDPAP